MIADYIHLQALYVLRHLKVIDEFQYKDGVVKWACSHLERNLEESSSLIIELAAMLKIDFERPEPYVEKILKERATIPEPESEIWDGLLMYALQNSEMVKTLHEIGIIEERIYDGLSKNPGDCSLIDDEAARWLLNHFMADVASSEIGRLCWNIFTLASRKHINYALLKEYLLLLAQLALENREVPWRSFDKFAFFFDSDVLFHVPDEYSDLFGNIYNVWHDYFNEASTWVCDAFWVLPEQILDRIRALDPIEVMPPTYYELSIMEIEGIEARAKLILLKTQEYDKKYLRWITPWKSIPNIKEETVVAVGLGFIIRSYAKMFESCGAKTKIRKL